MSGVLRAQTTDETQGFMKVLIAGRDDRILGFTMIGAEAGEVVATVQAAMLAEWKRADSHGERLFPHEFVFNVLRSGVLRDRYQLDPAVSWVHAAMEHDVPIFVPGWEDSTLGNIYAARCMAGEICNVHTVRSGVEYMMNPNWTVKVEYQYFDFGNNNFSCCDGVGSGRLDNSVTSMPRCAPPSGSTRWRTASSECGPPDTRGGRLRKAHVHR